MNFGELWPMLVDSLEEFKSLPCSWNRDTVTDAVALQVAITNFMAFIVIWKALTPIKGLSISLQSSSIDICKDVSITKECETCPRQG